MKRLWVILAFALVAGLLTGCQVEKSTSKCYGAQPDGRDGLCVTLVVNWQTQECGKNITVAKLDYVRAVWYRQDPQLSVSRFDGTMGVSGWTCGGSAEFETMDFRKTSPIRNATYPWSAPLSWKYMQANGEDFAFNGAFLIASIRRNSTQVTQMCLSSLYYGTGC